MVKILKVLDDTVAENLDGSNTYDFHGYHSVQGKHPLPGKCPCTVFQGVNVTASIQTYILGMQPKIVSYV